LDPCCKEAWNNMGWTLRTMGNLPEAKECFLKALEIDPMFGQAKENLADLERSMLKTKVSTKRRGER